ncbi:hypothetical protein HKD37_10G028164 [Glycine soja]
MIPDSLSRIHPDVASCRACRPWISFINGVIFFLQINDSGMEKEERLLEMPLQAEDESRTSSPP